MANAANASVLLIDDEADVAAANRAALEARGLSVRWVKTAEEAREALMDFEPDAVVLEAMAVGGEGGAEPLAGFDFADQLKGLAHGVPVVLLTRADDVLDAATRRRQDRDGWSQAERFFEKPVSPELVAEEVEHLIAEAAEEGSHP